MKQGIDLPNWVAYLTSSITFGGGLLGITYGIMSGELRQGCAVAVDRQLAGSSHCVQWTRPAAEGEKQHRR